MSRRYLPTDEKEKENFSKTQSWEHYEKAKQEIIISRML